MKVFIDQDGVLFDFTQAACIRMGIPFRDNLNGWDIIKEFGPTHGVTRAGVDRILADPSFWPTVRPYPWAKDMVGRLLAQGTDLYVLTSCRFAAGYGVKYQQLTDLHPGLAGRVIITDAPKHAVVGGDGILIDDGPDNLRPLGSRGHHWIETADAAQGARQVQEALDWVGRQCPAMAL